jgi:dTMP kinase
MAELGLMFSDRAQSIAEVIAPALSAGQTVLCDRFTDSTEAYQGGGRQLGSKIVLDLHKSICGGLNPDLTLLLLPDLDLSLGRARRRNERHAAPSGADENRFERENREFYMRVQSKYREIAARDAQRVVLLEGNATVREIHLKVADILQHRFRSDGAWKHAQEIS